MTVRRWISLVLIILGIGSFIFGSYVSDEVSHGEKKIKKAQKTVNQTRSLTKLSPYTKDLGDIAADAAQKKIDKGRDEASQYQSLANWLYGGGIALFIVGGLLLASSFIRKKGH